MVPPLIEELLREWMPLVHEAIVSDAIASNRNVTEWAKKPDCWAVIQNLPVDTPDELEALLGEGLPLPNVGAYRDGNGKQLTEEDKRRQEAVMAMTASDFARLFQGVGKYLDTHGMHQGAWMAMTGCLTTVQTYAQNGWSRVPTPKQTKQILKAIEFLEAREGGDLRNEDGLSEAIP